jgi:PAS domain S-box-containing protein
MPLINSNVPAQALLKRFALFYLPTVIALSIILFASFRFDEKLRVKDTGVREGSRIEIANGRITRVASEVDTDLRIIVNQPLLQRYLDSGNPAQRDELEKDFLNLAQETQRYDQIRYLDASGQEVIRINYNNGKPAIVPHEQLQNKADRYYFSDTIKLNQGEIFVSPLDLNIEHGRLEIPYKPMIRYGTPVFDGAGRKKGIILLNYFGNILLQDFQTVMQGGLPHSGMLLNRDGYWLSGADHKDEWGFMLGKNERTFGHDFPEAWRAISAGEHGSLLTDQGLFVYTTAYPLLREQYSSMDSGVAHTRNQQETVARQYYWKIVSFVPHDALSGAAFYNQPLNRTLLAIVYLLLALAAFFVALTTLRRKLAQQEIIKLNIELEKRVAERTASEQNLSVTLNSIGDAVMATDAEGRITRLNTVAEQLTGWSQAEAAGRPVADIFHIINQKTRLSAPIPVANTLTQGVIHGLANDTVLIARDGSEHPIADSCAPIRNRYGEVIGAILVFRDVTEEYAAKVALRDSATHIQTILDTVADAIITINEHGIIETVNSATERIFGYPATEVVGQNVNMLMPEPYRNQHDGYIRRYCSTGEAHIIGIGRDVEGQRKDGATFPMYLAVSEMRLDDQRKFTAIARDITARKEAEDQLNLFFDLSLDMLCIASADGYFKRINPAFTKTLGRSVEEILGRPFIDFVHPDDHAATLREVERQVAAGEKVLHFENRYLHEDGSWRILSWASVPHGDGLMFATARDVTESKGTEQAMVAAKEQAELANRAKDSFLATMSHEIRTPLTGMLGMLELLSLTLLDSEQRKTLDAAWESGRGLLRIVSDILDWSKIEEGKLGLSLRPTAISQLLQEVVNTYSRVASAKNLMLWQHADARLSPAYIVDPLRLSQVLNNFVSNAIKFTQSGEIELRAKLLEPLNSGDRIRFSVKDTGIGIAKNVQERLFQRYRQGSTDTARMYGGTGLGLAICRRLAEMMDGVVELESELGRGSVFSITLTLPISGAQAVTLNSPHPEVEQRAVEPLFDDSADAPLVLAVDDHPINRDLLARQIRLLGLRAETAENGQVALSMWRDGRFALVITDCHMPEMDGYEFSLAVRKIEAKQRLPRTTIIAWTANALAEESEHCQAAGMDDLLVKPANLAQLKKKLARWLSLEETGNSQPAPSPHDADSWQSTKPIDYATLKQIVPDSATQTQLLQDFQSHIRADRAELLEILEQDDQANVERTAHRMKGSSRMVGAKDLANACAIIEQAARDGDMAGARAARIALDEAFKQLEAYLVGIGKPEENISGEADADQ